MHTTDTSPPAQAAPSGLPTYSFSWRRAGLVLSLWVLAGAGTGALLAVLGLGALAPDNPLAALALLALLGGGALAGAAQAVVLWRSLAAPRRWLLDTALGWLIGMPFGLGVGSLFLGYYIMTPSQRIAEARMYALLGFVALGAAAGGVIGDFQRRALTDRLPGGSRAGWWWVVTSALGSAAGFGTAGWVATVTGPWAVGRASLADNALASVAGGLVYALVTGVVLVWWLRERRPSATAAPTATPEPAR